MKPLTFTLILTLVSLASSSCTTKKGNRDSALRKSLSDDRVDKHDRSYWKTNDL